MKNCSIPNQLEMQEQQISGKRKNTLENDILPDSERLVSNKQESIGESDISNDQMPDKSVSQSHEFGSCSLFSIFSPQLTQNIDEQLTINPKKKKKLNKGFKR